MQRIGAVLWPKLQCIQIYGANTNVGKTIVSTLLCSALGRKVNLKTHYLKPVSTGPLDEADNSHISKFAPNVSARTLFQFSQPVSPHLAVKNDGKELPDEEIQLRVHQELSSYANRGSGVALVETAGGVLSPAPSGNPQADLYRPLRLPVLLVGDYRLGGIATSISAFESLHLRGYDVGSVVLLEDDVYKNVDYLREYFEKRKIPTFGLPQPPEQITSQEDDFKAMKNYYDSVGESRPVHEILDTFTTQHEDRISKLISMPEEAHSSIWYPFTQHQGRTEKDILVIDSAYGDDFSAVPPSKPTEKPGRATTGTPSLLHPALDASASWWTQGLGHGNPSLSLSAAYAAGRYGHVMFASAINQPSLELAQLLLEEHNNPRLAKVYYTDNGSTGMEVGIKMALRASCVRYGWNHHNENIEVLGLKGSYHGDTMGVMDASEPSLYNNTIEWYKPRGYWFDFPQVKLKKGKWVVEPPPGSEDSFGTAQTFSSLGEVFDLRKRDGSKYAEYVTETITKLVKEQNRKFGGLVMEPVILGAGGMLFADPLFQHTLIRTIRENPSLISPSADAKSSPNWSGLPILYDEVFTGLYRLGRFNCSSYLQADPDIVVNAKLLTGGLVPLCTTTASQSIFEAFLSDEKSKALLHGHSYTAHAVGCNVAVESVKTMMDMERNGGWDSFKESWVSPGARSTDDQGARSTGNDVWSMWSEPFVIAISHKSSVEHVIALGSVLAITLKDNTGAGYNSTATHDLRASLLESKDGWCIHSRVLGNVIYFMSSQTASVGSLRQIEERVLGALE